MRLKYLTLLTALLGVPVMLAGCGSDDDDPVDTTPPPPTASDPWLVSAWFAGASANPPLQNRSDVSVELDDNGFPTTSSPALRDGTTYAFTAPADWEGEPVPAYIVDSDYIGAIDPATDATTAWTKNWTIIINGNEAVWDAATGGTLAGGTPAADGTCPAGTTLATNSFATQFASGDISNDETGLFTAGDYDICILARRYDTDGQTITLTNDNVYNIQDGFPGTVFGTGDDADAGNDVAVTVEIEPGTLIYGEPQEAFVVTRGARILALGTEADPIVFTSAAQLTNRFDNGATAGADSGRGEWAGLALMGRARSNECGSDFANCNVEAEGNVGSYGGDANDDDSGVLNYVIVRHAGNDIDGQGNELNGITYFATGSATQSDFIQVHRGLDDGIEHFGARDFVGHLVVTGAADDSVDWGQGWIGGAQFVLVVQESDEAGHGIEADNDGTNNNAQPISFPLLANTTFVGPGTAGAAIEEAGFNLRRGTRAQIWNTIVTGFNGGCIDLNDDATFDRAGNTAPDAPGDELVMRNSIVDCPAPEFIEE